MEIELIDVVRRYRVGGQSIAALDSVSLRLDGSEFVALVGPSGAGKSTLLHVLGALDTPTSGRVLVDGQDIGGLGDAEQARFRLRRVGFVFQDFNLMPTLSAWENVALPEMLAGHSIRQARARAEQLLERVGLGGRVEHRPAELSGGQMQRVAIARALLMDPPLILADEPTGNLDSRTGSAILDLLAELAHSATTARLVVLVTHDHDAAARTDRTITLRDGRIAADTRYPAIAPELSA
ncbi:ABC transporter ATP-binding protein [Nocardia goodfellowii]|uniref:ABC transport system ATP-binding protein n=1 Tax=Nocardia goodfellowii TaxID=882446 RepID=A0ABS4QIK2_9NOCA|nr:ABC transporter ATP-binding protein [Nocardia goodfellowii]MBP2191534.1 putative ABC transport system ATP-binding protein [Nocardia goodfellowii]